MKFKVFGIYVFMNLLINVVIASLIYFAIYLITLNPYVFIMVPVISVIVFIVYDIFIKYFNGNMQETLNGIEKILVETTSNKDKK